MTHLFRLATALAVLGLATPALPCDGHDHEKATTASTAEKTKASPKKAAKAVKKTSAEPKPVTASN